jgi:HEAT repeat protein
MKADEKLRELVESLPGKGGKDMPKDTDKEAMEKTLAEILGRGKEGVRGLADLIAPPGKAPDAKARYALHAVAVLACRQGKKERAAFAEALASTLADDRPADVKTCLIRELQVAGGKEQAPALGKFLTDEKLGEPAAQALLAIGPATAGEFRKALPRAKGKNRLTVVQALGVLRDADSAPALRKAVKDPDRDTRLAAAWALGNIGDAGSVALLLEAADVKPSWERTQATKACLVLAERLQAAGRRAEAMTIYGHLEKTRTDPSEEYIRDLAERAQKG